MKFSKTGKSLFLMAGLVLLLLSMSLAVFVSGAPSLAAAKGSISLDLRDPLDAGAIDGACFNLYAVAEPAPAAAQESLVYTAAFQACGIELPAELAVDYAQLLADYATDQELAAADRQTSEAGRLCFSGLAAGLYLLVQEGRVAGYYEASPFLVLLPAPDAAGRMSFALEAYPKIERKADPEPPAPQETEPELTSPAVTDPLPEAEPSDPPEREKIPQPVKTDPPDPEEPRLIQTGQVNWPVPLLATAGLLLFAYGWPVLFAKKDAGGMTGRPVAAELEAGAADPAKTAEAEDATDESQA